MNTIFQRLKGGISKLFSTGASADSFADQISNIEYMDCIEPFICNLPHGNQLWQYVLTGNGKQELESKNAFLDLDHTLISLHAIKHAPEFYTLIKNICRRDSLVDQYELYDDLYGILYTTAYELIESNQITNKQQPAFREAYLRLIDIFYYMGDQASLNEDFYIQLVVADETKFLDEQQYYQRYSQESFAVSDELPERLEKKIINFFEDVDDFALRIDLEKLSSMERAFAETRLTYEADFLKQNKVGSVFIASYLLQRDAQLKINDSSTQKLQHFVEQNLLSVIKKGIRDNDEATDTLVSWIESPDTPLDEQQLQAIKDSLSKDETKVGSPLGGKQDLYEIFRHVSLFINIICICYYLQKTAKFPIAKRVLELSFALAPQRTINTISKLYRKGYPLEFPDDKAFKTFLKNLESLGVELCHIKAFELLYIQDKDEKKYTWAMAKYAVMANGKKGKMLNDGLDYCPAKLRQQFFLDVSRGSDSPFTLELELPQVLENQLILNQAEHPVALVNRLKRLGASIEHYRWSEDIKFPVDKPLINDPDKVQRTENWRYMTVISEEQQNYRLHADDTEEDPVTREQDLYGHFIIIRDNPNDIDIQQIIDTFGDADQHQAQYIQAAKSYLVGEVSFAHYLANSSDYLDTSDFSWKFESSSMLSDSLLPFLLTDRDIERRNRLITIFCPYGKLSKSELFSQACAELYLEQLFKNDDIHISERWNNEVEISDLSEEFLTKYQKFGQELLVQVDNLRKGVQQ